ncbi:acyl-CoA thioesterase [Burkholderia humptydooensis]|uniref:Acyl-CoA thioesterase n=2 Tax=Burkholderiaceae TaxID=119060 RepID=A0A7T2U4T9_9BURK|nr:acyl-CoA thioesterase [Burkholderia humptydooensis]AJY42618.1 thioesterase superfamily protein [Burkholderia sp. 2002721687]QPS45529.1 acyl-CoA thioesterase [Burkholderia humptydooensis]
MSFETYHGVVYPAQTDAMGHMTVQYYVAAFDQAMWHLVARLGYNPKWRDERHEGWADVRYEIDFRSELRTGDLFSVVSKVVDAGRSSLKSLHRLVGPDGTVVAELAMTSVYFHLVDRKSIPIPDTIRERVLKASGSNAE